MSAGPPSRCRAACGSISVSPTLVEEIRACSTPYLPGDRDNAHGHYRFTVTRQKKRRVWARGGEGADLRAGALPGVSVSEVARRYDVNANLVSRGSVQASCC